MLTNVYKTQFIQNNVYKYRRSQAKQSKLQNGSYKQIAFEVLNNDDKSILQHSPVTDDMLTLGDIIVTARLVDIFHNYYVHTDPQVSSPPPPRSVPVVRAHRYARIGSFQPIITAVWVVARRVQLSINPNNSNHLLVCGWSIPIISAW